MSTYSAQFPFKWCRGLFLCVAKLFLHCLQIVGARVLLTSKISKLEKLYNLSVRYPIH